MTHIPRRAFRALLALPLVAALAAPALVPGAPVAAAVPSGYYAAAEGKAGEALKSTLSTIIDGNKRLSYSQVWEALKVTDRDPNKPGNVILFYKGTSSPATNNGGGADNWNREHIWAQSHGGFGTSAGPGTDLHHLRPTDVTVNSARGNLDFDNGGSVVAEAPGNRADRDSWEPRDEIKGDLARSLFYMAVRYEGADGVDLELNDRVNNGSAPLHGKVSVLKQWHEADPPSAAERARNDVIYADYQGNRNPFIDRPEWVESIW